MSDEPKGPFWHDYNPWKDRVIYVTETEWLDCLMFQNDTRLHYEQRIERTPFCDLYIMPAAPNSAFNHSMGMRYGRKANEYLSPYGDSDTIAKLITKYRGGADGT